MVEAARALGHEYLALTDHSPRLRVANGLSPERLRAQLEVVAGMSGDGFTLLSGIEVDILEDGGLDQEPDLLDELDVVVASAHSKLRMERGPMTRRLVAAVSSRASTCSGTSPAGSSRDRGARGRRRRFDAAAVFEACAAHGVAVEINSRPERQDPPDELIAIALELGCLFSIDSDAHAPGQLSLLGLRRGAGRAGRGARRADRDDVAARAPARMDRPGELSAQRGSSAVRSIVTSTREVLLTTTPGPAPLSRPASSS